MARNARIGIALATIVALVIGGLRPFVPTVGLSWSAAYQAAAHLLVGILIGAYCVRSPLIRQRPTSWQRWCLFLVVVLSAIEIICFAVGTGR